MSQPITPHDLIQAAQAQQNADRAAADFSAQQKADEWEKRLHPERYDEYGVRLEPGTTGPVRPPNIDATLNYQDRLAR